MSYSIAMKVLLASTLQSLDEIDTEVRRLVEPLLQRVVALVGGFFAPGSLAHRLPGIRDAVAT